MCIHMYICINVSMYTCIFRHASSRISANPQLSRLHCVCMGVCACTCVKVRMCVVVYVCAHDRACISITSV